MERQNKYLVIKLADASAALSCDQIKELVGYANIVDVHRTLNGKHPMECVVVECDWPEYETVWKMISDRVDGRPNAIEQRDRRIAELEAQLVMANAINQNLTRQMDEATAAERERCAKVCEALMAEYMAATKSTGNEASRIAMHNKAAAAGSCACAIRGQK